MDIKIRQFINKKLNIIWPSLLVIITTMSSAIQGGHAFLEGDTFWHIKNGLWILSHHTVPHFDPFSWTAAGKPWAAHEWLWDLMAALTWRQFGKIGLWLLMLLGVLLFGLSLYSILKSKVDCLTSAILTSMALLVIPSWWCARPHVLAIGLFALWIVILYFGRKQSKLLFWLVPLAILWANIHSSVIFGIGIMIIYLLLSIFDGTDQEYRKRLGLITILCLFSICISPQTYHIYSYAVKASSNPLIINNIDEWQSTNFHQPITIPVIIILFLILSLVIIRKKSPPIFDWVLFIITLIMSLMQVRQIPFFYFTSVMILSDLIPWSVMSPIKILKPVSLVVFIFALLAAWPLKINWLDAPRDALFYPENAVSYMIKNNYTYHVFNSYNMGGFLIFNNIKPFIDGRVDMYVLSSTDVFQDYLTITNGTNYDPGKLLDMYNVKTVLIQPYESLRWYLDINPNWKKVYQRYDAVIYIRR